MMSDATLTIEVDLRSEFGPVRAQGTRPTCAAFAASACHEHARRPGSDEMSVEYAFFYAVNEMPRRDRTRGVSFDAIGAALRLAGQPHESVWPYIIDLEADDEWTPPGKPRNLFRGELELLTTGIGSLRGQLESGRPVLVISAISKSFYYASGERAVNATPTERKEGTHAFVIAGIGKLKEDDVYLVRNSWGPRWGTDGYAWVHRDYLKPRLIVAGVFST